MIIRQNPGARLKRFPVVDLRQLGVALLTLFALIAGCALWLVNSSTSADNRNERQPANDINLNVITRVSLNTYYQDENGPSGFEYHLLELFAEWLGKNLVIHTENTLNGLFGQVSAGQVAFASAGLTATASRQEKFYFSEPYLYNQPIVVYKVGNQRPRNYKDLIGKDIVVVSNSSHSAAMSQIKRQYPALNWRELANVDYIDLLGRVETGEVDYTIIDSVEFLLHRGAFPQIKRAFEFGEEQSFNWMFAKTEHGKHLQDQANHFLREMRANGTLAKLEERFFAQASNVGQGEANEFAKNIKRRLPKYIDDIKRVADAQGMDWRLLAAISYQESRWNPKAKSPTGVRGMMMLTLPTAKELGVSNRLDLNQSLIGGAAYYQRLKSRLPARIQEPDRSWLALAAYNVGPGHLEDARRLAQSMGKDADSWYHVKQVLPLLTDPDWYSKTRYGYARGHEPVHYVQQVRHYYNVLQWQTLDPIQRHNASGGIYYALYEATEKDAAQLSDSEQLNEPTASLEQSAFELMNEALAATEVRIDALLPHLSLKGSGTTANHLLVDNQSATEQSDNML